MEDALKQEMQYQFIKFDSNDALIIGNYISNYAIENDLAVCTDIFVNGKQLFHFSSDKCTVDNDNWLRRKRNVVLQFNHSSQFMYRKIKGDMTLLQSKYGLDIKDYSAIDGGFPVIIENTGVIGAICVSGMQPIEDHNLILEAIDYLNKK